jgi:uncharacterized DUF497 family protein
VDAFEWNETKAASNVRKHGISFNEAMTVFEDRMQLTIDDPDHSMQEERYLTMGLSSSQRLLVVSHTDRGGVIRIISARKANKRERKDYEDGGFP